MAGNALAIAVLAAGSGTRMKSSLAKVLHPVAGQPMLAYTLAAARALDPAHLLVVVGRDADRVRETFAGAADFVLQEEPRGTGHAVLMTEPALRGFRGDALVLYADTPLLRPETLWAMVDLRAGTGADLVMLTAPVDVPGIVVRGDDGRVARVVETTDASEAELAIEERNTGVYLIDAELLFKTLAQVGDGNEQGEIYLTSIIEILVREGRRVEAVRLAEPDEALGINTRAQLARAEAVVRARVIAELQDAGVTIVDPASTWIDVDVAVGADTRIEPGCVIQGDTRIGERCHLRPHCVIESSELCDDVTIGPSAHLRTGTRLGRGSRIGNFVEVKNSVLGEGVKADHLAYIGDADVGDGATFGCGAITVNYDWREKHRTVIGAGAAIGCNANLVAPVTIGRNASVAAGSTITSNVPDGSLAVARAGQRTVPGWSERRRPKAVASSAGAAGANMKAGEKVSKKTGRTKARKKNAGKKTGKKAARTPASQRRR